LPQGYVDVRYGLNVAFGKRDGMAMAGGELQNIFA
jgi:hypothetical protein